ncbi:MAG: HNH endonuclease [Bauldia sp.]
MPTRAPRVCGCGLKVVSGEPCPCERRRRAAAEHARPTARERGYDSKWQRESKAFLNEPQNRFCSCGCGRPADVVDHKVAHKGDKRLFWGRSNWQPMARACNSRKAVRYEGGFGNPTISNRADLA